MDGVVDYRRYLCIHLTRATVERGEAFCYFLRIVPSTGSFVLPHPGTPFPSFLLIFSPFFSFSFLPLLSLVISKVVPNMLLCMLYNTRPRFDKDVSVLFDMFALYVRPKLISPRFDGGRGMDYVEDKSE